MLFRSLVAAAGRCDVPAQYGLSAQGVYGDVGIAFAVVEEHAPLSGFALQRHGLRPVEHFADAVGLGHAERFFQPFVGVDFSVSEAVVPFSLSGVEVVFCCLAEYFDHLRIGQRGIGLQPEGDDAGCRG